MPDGNTIRSVAKAMELLQLLCDAGEPLALGQISARAGLPRSTVFGLLTTMLDYDVVTQHSDGKYALGLRLFEYGCRVSSSWDISAVTRPYLEHLASEVGASAMLCVHEGGRAITLEQAEGRGDLRVVSEIGARLPLYCTSQGKLFLSALPRHEAAGLLHKLQLIPYTPHTLTDPEVLLAQLEEIRQNGYAVENGEYKIGLRSISAPVYQRDGALRYTVGVIGMFRSVHSPEFDRAIGAVVSAGQMISAALGYEPVH